MMVVRERYEAYWISCRSACDGATRGGARISSHTTRQGGIEPGQEMSGNV